MKKKTQDVYIMIRKAKEERAKELADLEKNLELEKRSVEAAKEEAAQSLSSGNESEFVSARLQQQEAECKVEFFELRLSETKEKPLFSDQKINEITADIKQGLDVLREEKLDVVAKSISQCTQAVEELLAAIEQANQSITDIVENTGRTPNKVDSITVGSLYKNIGTVTRHTLVRGRVDESVNHPY